MAPVPKRSQEHLDARRAQILEGAQRCFARHGYAGATVARLEQEIGLSRGAIFNYFGGKRQLFAEVSIQISVRFSSLVAEAGLEAAVRAMAAEDPAWLAVLIETQAKLRHDPEFVRLLDEAFERSPKLSPWVEARQQEGVFRGDIAPQGLTQFVGMILNGLALRVASGEETDVDSLLHLLHDALAPRE
jgi:TetR/AcrR family transcriptional regulator, transcriptional repressor of aconitase